MSWFHHNKTERLTAAIRARRDQAESVRKHLRRREFYVLNPRILEEAEQEAAELSEQFEEEFHEATPEQVRKASELEVQFWTALRGGRDTKDYSDDAYERLQVRMNFIATALIDLLSAEEEMMTSPLVAHYLQVIDALHANAKRGDT